LLRRFLALYQEAHLSFFAAALAYYALFSLMPFLFLLLGVFGFFLKDPSLERSVLEALSAFTESLFPTHPETAGALLGFLARGAFPLTLASGLLLLWSSSNFFAALTHVLTLLFGGNRPRGGLRSRVLGLFLPLVFGLGLILLAFLGLGLGFLLRFLPPEARRLVPGLLPLAATYLLFFLAYLLLPPTRPGPKAAATGAALATALFEAVRLGLPGLLPRSQYELLYGPLAGFVLVLLGFYLTMWVLLAGALVVRLLSRM
jgi:membrane protein